MKKINERNIQAILYQRHQKAHKLLSANTYLYEWESDFISVTKAGFVHEYEIKISRADFKNEDLNKKDKYQILLEGQLPTKYEWEKKKFGDYRSYNRPNYFWYVVPRDLITAEEIKGCCGLIYVEPDMYGHLEVIKQSPRIHKEKITNEQSRKILDSSYYKYWRLWIEETRRLNNG